MIKGMLQCNDFLTLLCSGIKIGEIPMDKRKSILIDWILMNTKMDDSTCFHVNMIDEDVCGMVEVNETMSLGITFRGEKVIFHLLPPEPDMKYIETEYWKDIWLYDLRIQTSVAILIKIIRENYPELKGEDLL